MTDYHQMTGRDRPCEACIGEMQQIQRETVPHGYFLWHCQHHEVGVIAAFNKGVLVSKRAYTDVTEAAWNEANPAA